MALTSDTRTYQKFTKYLGGFMQFILLTGHRKSGTTLLHKLFDGHPQINIYPVDLSLLYAFFPCWTKSENDGHLLKERISLIIRKSSDAIEGKPISRKVKEFRSNEFLDLLWKRNKPDRLVRPASIMAAVAESYCEYADLDPAQPFLFKETSQLVNFQGMIDDGLDVKMIQIIRDPRDNYAAIKAGVANYYSKMGEDESESLASTTAVIE